MPLRATPMTRANPPSLPAVTPASASSMTTQRSGPDSQSTCCLDKHRGIRLAGEAELFGKDAVNADIEQVIDSRRNQHVSAIPA